MKNKAMIPAMLDRREWLQSTCFGLGSIALSTLLGDKRCEADQSIALSQNRSSDASAGSFPHALPGLPHHAPRARHVIFLAQSGAPSQLDLFDSKPELEKQRGKELPDSVRRGQKLTTMTAEQISKPIMPSPFRFARHGASGASISELLPHTARIADQICIIRSMYTETINHDPAMTLLQTGTQLPGHPSAGAWVSYGLGNDTENLPAFVVMFSGGEPGDQPISARLWGSAYLPSRHQGVRFRAGKEAVLYLSNPPGIDGTARRDMLDTSQTLNERHYREQGDAETLTRIAQFETAFQMQSSVPRLADFSDEPASTFELYGEDARRPGTYASNCLMARRLVERGVRFVELFHRGWDHHERIAARLPGKCQQTDRASAALVQDLAQRGLLDETLVVWGGEFGRTVFSQGELESPSCGRDHHPRCFSLWLAGGGIREGITFGRTDDFSYQIVENPVHVHDLQATMLHLLGIDHTRFTVRHQGRDVRLTDIGGRVVREILS